MNLENIYDISKKEQSYSIFGLLLGDGSKNGNYIRCSHTNKQKEYVKFIANFCRKTGIEFKTKFDYDKITNYGKFTYSEINVKIPDCDHFNKFNRFYDSNGRKIISDYVLARINEWGLLFWFLDDGTLSINKKYNDDKTSFKISRFANLATHYFNYEMNCKIQTMFKERFGIDTVIHKDRHYFKLYFSATNFRKFFDLVRPLLHTIPKEMYYKFDMKYTQNRLSNSQFLSENYNMPLSTTQLRLGLEARGILNG